MPELAYLNGNILPIDQAMVPIEDRGYQFGDAVYEYIASYGGKLFFLEEHLDRLERSMAELSFPPVSRDKIRQAIVDLFERSGIERAGLYLQISRGVAPRNHPIPDACRPQVVMTVRPVMDKPPVVLEQGAAAITTLDQRWGRCDIKTVQLVANVLAKQKALAAGCAEAILVSAEGVVREATSSNVFIVKNNRLVTHPLTPEILPGITRQLLIEICRQEKIAVDERFFGATELFAADEVFLTGTVTEVFPIVKVDNKTIGAGKPGPMSARLLELLYRRIK
jgi:D-alanine transaminase